MKPGLHHYLEFIVSLFFFFFHFLVVFPVLNSTLIPLLDSIGIATELEEGQDFNLGLTIYWGANLVVFVAECYVVYRVHCWKGRNKAVCPECGWYLESKSKMLSATTIYKCERCGYSKKYESQGHHGGGGE